MDEKIYEKPTSKEDAFKMIKSLSKRSHKVYTGVSLVKKNADSFKVNSFYESSEVTMAELSDEIVHAYIETGEPFDKAGGYGIQDLGATLIKSINGDYFNIEGFPAHKLAKELSEFVNL